MKYIYWWKQQAVAFTFIALAWGITYIITLKCGLRTEIILTAEHSLMLLSYALTFIFIGPFFYKWWDPLNKGL